MKKSIVTTNYVRKNIPKNILQDIIYYINNKISSKSINDFSYIVFEIELKESKLILRDGKKVVKQYNINCWSRFNCMSIIAINNITHITLSILP